MQKSEKKFQRAFGRSAEGADDRVSLLGLSRRVFRDLEADVRLAVDLRAAGRSDDLAETIDYAALAEGLRAVAAASRFRLLEALAEALAAEALRDPRVGAAEIALRKPDAVPEALAEVRIVRRRGRAAR